MVFWDPGSHHHVDIHRFPCPKPEKLATVERETSNHVRLHGLPP